MQLIGLTILSDAMREQAELYLRQSVACACHGSGPVCSCHQFFFELRAILGLPCRWGESSPLWNGHLHELNGDLVFEHVGPYPHPEPEPAPIITARGNVYQRGKWRG